MNGKNYRFSEADLNLYLMRRIWLASLFTSFSLLLLSGCQSLSGNSGGVRVYTLLPFRNHANIAQASLNTQPDPAALGEVNHVFGVHVRMIKRARAANMVNMIVGVAYSASLLIIEAVFSALGVGFTNSDQSTEVLLWQSLAGIVTGLVLGPIATQIAATRLGLHRARECSNRVMVSDLCELFFDLG